MLTLPAVLEVDGITVFRDDDDNTQFYYLPKDINLVTNPDGSPQFDFVVYDVGDDAETATSGGYLLFTVALTSDRNAVETRVKPEVQRILRDEFPPGEIVPQPKIAPVSFLNGTAELLIASAGGELVSRIQLGKPSLFGDNTVSVIAEMPIDGAAVFASVLEQGGSIATIEYNLNFEARLPSVVVTAHIEASRVRDVVNTWTTQKIKESNTWGSKTRTERKRTGYSEILEEENLVELDIKAGSSEVDLSDDLVSDLQDFAMASMDRFIEDEWMAGGILSEEDMRSEWLESIHEEVQRNFDMSLTTRDVITRPYNPSASVNPTFLGGDPSDFVKRVSIGDDFFKRLEVDVQTNLDFEKYQEYVHSVVVNMHYQSRDDDGNNISKSESFTFTADDHAPKKFVTKMGRPKDDSYEYSVEVVYKGGPVEKRQVEKGTSRDRSLIAAVKNPGELNVTFNSAPEVFGDRISAIEIKLEYADPRNKVKRFTEELILNAEKPSATVRKAIFAEVEKDFAYSYVYVMDGGNQRVSAGPFPGAPDTQYISIPSPFENMFTLMIQPLADWSEMTSVIVGLSYEDVANDFRKSNTYNWDQETSSDAVKWAFPIVDPDKTACTVSETWIRKTGGSVTLPARQINIEERPVLVVGDALGGIVNVEIDAGDVDFENSVRRIMINLVYRDDENNVLDTAAFVFRNAQETQKWVVALSDNTKRAYTYDLKYFMNDGSVIDVTDQGGEFAGMQDFMFIPAPPQS